MEQRKLIRLGNSSFAISLPKDWLNKSGLKKGDDIFIVPNSNGELVVSPKFKRINEEKEEIINVDGKEEKEIARDIISAYVSGVKTIFIVGEKNKIKIAKEITKQFLNLELIDEKEGKVAFKDLLDIENVEIENFIRRMNSGIKDMFLILSNLSKDRILYKEKIKELQEIDRDVTKFYFLIWRIMNLGVDNPSVQANLKINPKSFVRFFWIAYNIEQIGDELKRIGREINVIKKDKYDFKEIINLTSDSYDKSMKAFLEKNKDYAKEVILKREEMVKMCEKLSHIRGFEAIAEKLQQINANIHNNSKMIFYEG